MKTILVIEDNLEVRENTAEIIELAGYKVLTAENGKIGIELAKNHIPDLIICDIMMPELDGYGVIYVLSKMQETSSIPFIFLTAKTEKSDMRKGMSLGADDYLTKPFDDLELLDVIELRLKKNELIRRNLPETIDEPLTEAKVMKKIETLISENKINKYKKKQLLFTEGNSANFLYFVIKGKVKSFKTNDESRKYILGLHGDGDFIGYVNLLENSVYTESAAAMEDSEICVIPKREFFELIFSSSSIAEKFIKMLSKDVRESEERLLKLAYDSVRKRVAESLLMLKKNYEPENSNCNFSIPVSREDMASITGASKETVIRTLSDFKDEKLIDICGSTITIVNENKLVNMRN